MPESLYCARSVQRKKPKDRDRCREKGALWHNKGALLHPNAARLMDN